jgi:hypothetical protein
MPNVRPVAEYRGIAIWEVCRWEEGLGYKTDGRPYLAARTVDGDLELLGFESERAAKKIIDAIRDQPQACGRLKGVGLAEREYLGWAEAWEAVFHEPWTGEVPKWYWNDRAGHFFSAEDRLADFARRSGWPPRLGGW